MSDESDPNIERLPNRLIRKVPNADALRGKPDLYVIQKLDAVVARERQNYIPEMVRDVEFLVRLLREQADPNDMWPVSHELRCLAGTFGYKLLSEVARIFCTLVQEYKKRASAVVRLPPDVSDVFAAALLRARDVNGPYANEEEAILLGLRTIVAREAKVRS